jgi:hypothetical protein
MRCPMQAEAMAWACLLWMLRPAGFSARFARSGFCARFARSGSSGRFARSGFSGRSGGARIGWVVGVCLGVVLGASLANGQPGAPASYPVRSLTLDYVLPHPDQPPVAELMTTRVALHRTSGGYKAPQVYDTRVEVRLDALPAIPGRFFPSGLQQVSRALIEALHLHGIDGVIVTVPGIEEGSGLDLRPAGSTNLRLRIWTGRVSDVSTYADGDRWADLSAEQRIDHAEHDWMLDSSPVAAGGPNSLLDVGAIDDHARRLSRHPGRRVDAEIAPGREPGSSEVRYRVAESKPWFAYAQWSNTGTRDTTRSRPRFGFVHNQLFGIDDSLRLDYVSGNFDEVQGFFGSYEVPIAFEKRLRLIAAGSYSEYDASSVGLSFANFKGEQAEGGIDLLYEAFQWKELFVDVLGGARWVHAEVDNKLVGTKGKTDFFLPQVGVRVERETVDTTLRFGATVDFNVSGIANTSTKDIVLLGRADGDKNFARLLWGGTFSAYLEALIDRAAWADTSTPASSTLAHEGFLSFRGQHTFGQRVAPQFEMVSGGLYTVRGYNQSLVAADTVVMTTAEYRLHLPRLLYPEPLPREAPVLGSFRTAPQYVYGSPDWDLILRAFFDIAWLEDADAFDFEPDDTKMMGAGAGIELTFLRNFSARYDVGVALDRVGGRANLNSVRHYVVVSFLY